MKRRERVSRRWRFGFVAIYLLLLLSPFLSSVTAPISQSPVANAATNFTVPSQFKNGHWFFLDRTHIGFYSDTQGTTIYEFQDAQLDRQIDYGTTVSGPNGNSDGQLCGLSVDLANKIISDPALGSHLNISDKLTPQQLQNLNPLTVHYRVFNGGNTNKCGGEQSYNVNISQHDLIAFNVIFSWQDPGKIARVDSSYADHSQVYIKRDASDSRAQVNFEGQTWNVFVKQNSTNGVSCPSILLAPTNPQDTSTGYYEEDTTSKTSFPSLVYPKPDSAGTQCYIQADGNNLSKSGVLLINDWTDAQKNPASSTLQQQSGGGSSCDITGGLGWIFCPVIDMLNTVYDALKGEVANILKTPALTPNNYQGAYQVWQVFRNLTNIFFVIIFLIAIFSTTLSIGLSNYDVKKILPKLVAAAIFVQFSWLLMQLGVDITNILAAGITGLFSAIPSLKATGPSGVFLVLDFAFQGLIIGALAVAFALPALFALFGIVLGILAVFLTLELRLVILLVLIVLSPIAFMAWVLPNTEGFFKAWLKMFTRLLLMYPLIILIFAMASIAQTVVKGGAGTDPWQQLFAAFIPIIAFYAVPMTFRWAGSAMNAVGGFLTARASGAYRGVRGSQFAKDRFANRQEKGLRQAHRQFENGFLNNTGGRAYRAIGRTRSGTGLLGSNAARRRENAYASYLKTRGDEFEKQFNANNFTPDDLEAIALGKNTKGVRADVAARARATEKLIENGMDDRVGAIKAQYGSTPWYKQAEANHRGDMVEKMPHLMSDPAAVKALMSNMSPDKVLKLSGGSIKDLRTYNSDDRVVSLLKEIATSQARRGQVTANQSGAINQVLAKMPDAVVGKNELMSVFTSGGVDAGAVSSLGDEGTSST